MPPSDSPSDHDFSEIPWFTFGRRETGEELAQKWKEQAARLVYLSRTPHLHFFVEVVKGASVKAARRVAEEFLAQSYPHWRLSFLAEGETARLTKTIDELGDVRLQVEAGANLADASWEGADYVGVVELGTTLSPVALMLLAESLNQFADTDVLYWNAVSVSENGKELQARVKRPRFSPFAFSQGNVLEGDWVMKASLADDDRIRPYFCRRDSFLAQALKLTSAWRLLPAVLSYHRRPLLAEVTMPPAVTDGQVAEKPAPLTVIVCFKDKVEWTARAVMDFFRASGYLDVKFLLVDNGSQQKERDKLERALGFLSAKLRVVDFAKPFNFAAMHNWAIREHVDTENIFLLNNDVFWGEGSVRDMLRLLSAPDVATVGIPLKYPSGKYQHLGFRAFLDAPPHQIRVAPLQRPGPVTLWSREVFANTFAACFLKRSVFVKLGGLSELEMANGFGDVAFCLEAGKQGYRNLFYATAWATHLESGTRGRKYEYWEEAALMRRFPDRLSTMEAEEFSLEIYKGLEWLRPLLGSAKESMRKKGGQWDALREFGRQWMQKSRAQEATP